MTHLPPEEFAKLGVEIDTLGSLINFFFVMDFYFGIQINLSSSTTKGILVKSLEEAIQFSKKGEGLMYISQGINMFFHR